MMRRIKERGLDSSIGKNFPLKKVSRLPLKDLGLTNSRNPEYMLSRFFEIDCENEPLRYEAAIAIGEERVQQGDNMLRKKVAEEGWYAAENGGSSIDPERGSILNQDPSA